jgi:hypothetical protein
MPESHFYFIYGLKIRSEIPIHELPEEEESAGSDVHIRYGNPPEFLDEPKTVGQKYEARPKQLLIKTNKIARILISGGNQILVKPLPGSQDYQLRMLLLGWGFGALFQQRYQVALHGSVISDGEAGFVICAPSGVGKSSLTAAFIQKGYLFLDDNIAVFSPSVLKPVTFPGFPQIKLWEDALDKLNLGIPEVGPIFPNIPRFTISFAEYFHQEPVEIRVIYILSTSFPSRPGLTLLSGHDSFKALISQIFCSQFITDISDYKALFSRLVTIAMRTKVVLVNLPEPRWALADLAEIIEQDFKLREEESIA